ncbi:hypothetical protein ABCR94_02420 [Streptomyces sp. 21So2-11]|uniref:hypothetical protein n=1 Tax=Streptomyces sp. 21So2-11 TaxID=3144408 RepID=UPI003219E323
MSSLREIKPQLLLGAADVVRLAPLVEECRASIPEPGRCRACKAAGVPVRIPEVEGFVDTARRGASAVRAVLCAA